MNDLVKESTGLDVLAFGSDLEAARAAAAGAAEQMEDKSARRKTMAKVWEVWGHLSKRHGTSKCLHEALGPPLSVCLSPCLLLTLSMPRRFYREGLALDP